MKRWEAGDRVRLQKDDEAMNLEGKTKLVAGNVGVVAFDTDVNNTYVPVIWDHDDNAGHPIYSVAEDLFNITSWEDGIEERKEDKVLTNSDFEYLTGFHEGDEVVIIELDGEINSEYAVGDKGVVIDINPWRENEWYNEGHLITVETERGHRVTMFHFRFKKVEPEADGFYTKYPNVDMPYGLINPVWTLGPEQEVVDDPVEVVTFGSLIFPEIKPWQKKVLETLYKNGEATLEVTVKLRK